MLCACIIRSDLIKNIRGQGRCRLFVVMPVIDNAVLGIDALCRHSNIRDESNTNSGVRYDIRVLGVFCFRDKGGVSYFLSRSVRNPISWPVTMYIFSIASGAWGSLPLTQLSVIAIKDILRGVCGQSN